MIKRVEDRIKFNLLLLLTLFIVLISVLSYAIIRNNIYNNFAQLSSDRIKQQNQNISLYMKLTEGTVRLITENKLIIDRLKSGSDPYGDITRKLDGVRATSLGIKGISIFTPDNQTYLTDYGYYSPTNAGTLQDYIKSNSIGSADGSFWMIRHSDVDPVKARCEAYFTYISTISDANSKLLGYLAIDTDLNTLTEYYRSNSGKFFNNTDTYTLASDGKLLEDSGNSKNVQIDLKEIQKKSPGEIVFINNNSGILTISPIPSSKDSIIEYIPMNIKTRLNLVGLLFLIVSIVCIMLCRIGVYAVSDSIIQPLVQLYNKMHRTSEKGSL